MTWQATLALCLYAGWVGLHSWLGKKQYFLVLIALIVSEVIAFAGIIIWLQMQDYDASAGAAAGLIIFAGGFALLVPAAVGGYSLWKNGTTRAL